MNDDWKCNEDKMCVHLEKQIVPEEKAGFIRWDQIIRSRIQLCGVAYKKTAKDKPFLIEVCPWCGEKPGNGGKS